MLRQENTILGNSEHNIRRIEGSNIQKHWKILTFHEKRLDNIDNHIKTLEPTNTDDILNNILNDIKLIKSDLEKCKNNISKLQDNAE